MKKLAARSSARKTIIWLLAIVTVLYAVSGFGITEFRTVEALTFGLLTKNLAFWIHNALSIPFALLLVLHISLQLILRQAKE